MVKNNFYNDRVKSRYIFLFDTIDASVSKQICQELLTLEMEDPGVPIIMYIMCYGGSVYPSNAIYDMMQSISSPVYTLCCGYAMSAAAIILSGGEPGFRFSFPNSRIMIHQPNTEIEYDSVTDVKITLKEVESLKKMYARLLSKNSKKSFIKTSLSMERDNYISAQFAKKYGIIDHVIKDITGMYSKITEKHHNLPTPSNPQPFCKIECCNSKCEENDNTE